MQINNKHFVLLIFFCLCTTAGWGQLPNYTLRTDESGASKAYVATDFISMKPGFSYKASGSTTFSAKINDPQFLYVPTPTSNTYAKPDGTITTDPTQGAVVGSIPGQFAVSATGGATYTIPIECPAGINGLQPNISLAYNSQGGGGSAGIGWGITGLSAIGKTLKNIFSDNAVSGLDLSINEKYTLDGNVLLPLTGVYGNDGATYQTENKTYSIIKSLSQTRSGGLNPYPLSFNVTTKDGQKIEYSNLVLPVQNTIDRNGNPSFIVSQPLQWLINKVTDANGNIMTFSYIQEMGIIPAIKSISYGDVSVEYDYDQKQVIPKAFMNGYYLQDKYLLRHIRIVVKGTIIKQYDLTYNYNSQKEKYFLKDVTLVGLDNVKLNSTKIEWGADYTTVNTSTTLFPNTSNSTTVESNRIFTSSDIDGDGFSDLVEFYHVKVNNRESDCIRVHKLKSENGVISFQQTIFNRSIGTAVINSNLRKFNCGDFFADFDGNGKKTIIVPRYYENIEEGIKQMQFNNVFSGGSIKHSLGLTSEMTTFAVGDINNDGIDEIISMEKSSDSRIPRPTKAIFYINKADRSNDSFTDNDIIKEDFNFEGKIFTNGQNYVAGKPKGIFLTDFNGDGLKDLLITTEIGCFFMKNNGGEKWADGVVHVTFTEMKNNIITDFNSDYSTIKAGDFNGDGLIDLILNEHCNTNWKLAINNGKWGFDYYPLSNFTAKEEDYTSNNDDKEDCIVTDFNHDGKSDVILVDPVYNSNNFVRTNVNWYACTGTAFNLVHSITTTDDAYTYNRYNTVDDFDGDGKEDIFSFGSDLYSGNNKVDNQGYFYSTFNTSLGATDFNTNFEANQVKFITDGMGAKTSISYRPLTYTDNFYTKGGTSVYPVADIVAPINCVQTVRQPIDNMNISTTQYAYSGAKTQLTGKGFLGFTSQTVSNAINNTKVVSTTELEYPYCLPKTQTLVSSALTQGTEISSVETTISNTKNTNNVYSSLPLKTIETNSLNGLSKTTEYLHYDDWGNLTDIKTTQGGLSTTQTMGYDQFGAWAWCPNKLVSSITTSQLTNDPTTYTRKKTYNYDSATGNLITEITDPDDVENKVTTSYSGFDTWGHPQIVSVTTPAVATARTSQVTYTVSGRFVASKINNLGETTTYDWDETRGVLNSETDYRNNSTSYRYDGWGNLIGTRYPTGIRATQALQWASPNNAIGAKYCATKQTAGAAPTTVWYDALGRELQRDSYGLNTKKISVTTEYYADGKVYRTSEPYFQEDAATKTWAKSYTYDEFGRQVTVTTPMGTSTTSYADTTTTLVTPEGTQETVLNASGQILTSKVNGKAVTYTYYPSGLTKTSTPENEDAVVAMEYDLQGNRTKLVDPDGGTVVSKYNGFGQLLWEKQRVHLEKDTVVTTNIYLNNGLLDKIVRGVGAQIETTTYTYDPQYKSRVNAIEISGKNKQTFSFDDFDRVTNVKEEIGAKVYNTAKEYDALGRVTKDTYPSGYYTTNVYDNYSNLTEVKDQYNHSVRAIDENARGQLLHENKGGKVTTFSFDERGLPTGITADGIVKAVYSFDPRGNLAYRTDELYSNNIQKEVFIGDGHDYDNHNRLTYWGVYKNDVLITPNTVTYNGYKSNMYEKSDLGSYGMSYSGYNPEYDFPIGPHALTSMGGVPSSFPQPVLPDGPMPELIVTYTDFKKVATLTEMNKYYELTYGVDDQRRMSVYKEDGITKLTRYYVGNYEEETDDLGNTKKIHYLSGAIFIQESNQPDKFYYSYADYQGSLIALTNDNGTLVERYAYDPWGVRRNPDDWSQNDSRTAWIVNRGYTGHEHLDAFGIINMNGRVYDPYTAMFFSPDPYIQAPGDWLNYNRYSYCYGNPFKYTDPSGEYAIVDDVIAAVIGGVINLTVNIIQGNIHGDFWTCLGKGAAAFGAGALSGFGALYPEFGGWVWGGATVGATNAWLGGAKSVGDIALGAGIGAVSSVVGGAVGQVAAKNLGGVVINGLHVSAKSALGGAITGAIGGGAGGYAAGFTSGLIMTGGDIQSASKTGVNGMWMGAGIGAGSGAVGGYKAAKDAKLNPWTGKPLKSVTIGEGMTTDPARGWLGVDKIADDLGSTKFEPQNLPKESWYTDSKLMLENGKWLDNAIQNNNVVYDRGSVGNNSQYYNMEVGRTMSYPNIITVRPYYNSTQSIRMYYLKYK